MASSSIITPAAWARKVQARKAAKRVEAFGRRVGGVHGSWVTDLAELKQTVLMCSDCDHKFRSIANRYHYEHHQDFYNNYGGVIGNCDACKKPGQKRKVYIHQSNHGKV